MAHFEKLLFGLLFSQLAMGGFPNLKPIEENQWVLLSENPKIEEHQHPSEFVPDPLLGFRHRPNSTIRHAKRVDGRIIFDAQYQFDQYSRRVTPIEETGGDFFAIFLGGSFTYGNGLNNNETLPYFFSKINQNYHSYNYGIGATGTNTALALIQKTPIKQQIKQKRGLFVYVFIDAHVSRANGLSPDIRWLKDTPYYEEKSGSMETRGSFTESRPWETRFYFFVQKIQSWFGLENRMFPSIDNDHIRYTCRLTEKMNNEINNVFNGSQLLVLIHPSAGGSVSRQYADCLKELKVAVLKPEFSKSEGDYFDFDHHPTQQLNQKLADWLGQQSIVKSFAETK